MKLKSRLIGNPASAIKLAGDEYFSPTTMGLVGGLLGEYVAEKALFSAGRSVFGDSGAGLSPNERLARHLARLGLGILGAAVTVSSKKEAEKAFGMGLMAEATVSLLKGLGLSFN